MSSLPADGLLDGPLLQVDVVVEGGGALVIVCLEMGRVHSPFLGVPAAGRCRGTPALLPTPGGRGGTHRPGQVAAQPLPLHQLQVDVHVELPAVLDVLVAAQCVLAAGTEPSW